MDFEIKQGRYAKLLIPPMINPDGSTYSLLNTTSRFMIKKFGETDAEAQVDLFLVINGAGVVTSFRGMTAGGVDTTVEPDVVYSGVASGAITIEIEDEDTETTPADTYAWEFVVIKNTKVEQGNSGEVTVVDTLIDDPETLPA